MFPLLRVTGAEREQPPRTLGSPSDPEPRSLAKLGIPGAMTEPPPLTVKALPPAFRVTLRRPTTPLKTPVPPPIGISADRLNPPVPFPGPQAAPKVLVVWKAPDPKSIPNVNVALLAGQSLLMRALMKPCPNGLMAPVPQPVQD